MASSQDVDDYEADETSQGSATGTYSDDEILAIVRAEMRRSIGFENDAVLRDSRERALRYEKGDMSKDIPHLDNRSRAVSTDLSDAIETLMPDIMEVLTGGEDVVAFNARGPQDEQGAKQETEYLKKVIFQDNPGFLNFYTAVKDALLLKICVFKFQWEANTETTDEEFTGKNHVEVLLASRDGKVMNLTRDDGEGDEAANQDDDRKTDEAQAAETGGETDDTEGQSDSQDDGAAPSDDGQDDGAQDDGADAEGDNEPDISAILGQMPTFSFTLRKVKDLSRAKYEVFPADDFSCAPDTVRITDATYCVLRARPRVQDLLAEGYDADVVRKLEPYAGDENAVIEQARDNAGEHLDSQRTDDTTDDLRQTEIREHYVRLIDDENKLRIWKVITDENSTFLLKKDDKTRWEEERIPLAVGTPYLVAHRLYGDSLADKLFELCRIKTVLTRTMLDSAYFALNQRYEVATMKGKAGAFTISDLMRNEPGLPVRSLDGNSVRVLNPAPVPFDGYAALEYFSTVAEQRTGVVRNAQGLNPDTLHDTAAGAAALMTAAQKRVRMIIRILAETCMKELYLGMHACIRENGKAETIAKLGDGWVPIDPSKWAERNEMTIEVGFGASGQAQDMAAIAQIDTIMEKMVTAQGGPNGPLITFTNLYNASMYAFRKLGVKMPERFITNPANAQQAQPGQQPPKPDPEMAKVQGELQLKQQSAQADMKLAEQKAQLEAAQTQRENEAEDRRQQQKMANELQLERERIASAERIAIVTARINSEAKIAAAQASAAVPSGNPQAVLVRDQQMETTP